MASDVDPPAGEQAAAPEPGSDAALLAAHVAGDPARSPSCVRRHRDRLWAVAIRTLGDPEDAADAVQDALSRRTAARPPSAATRT